VQIAAYLEAKDRYSITREWSAKDAEATSDSVLEGVLRVDERSRTCLCVVKKGRYQGE